MNLEAEKRLIIDEISNIQDEWIVKAIKKLLDIDFHLEVTEEHQQILNERLASYEANPFQVLEWNEVKKDLLNK